MTGSGHFPLLPRRNSAGRFTSGSSLPPFPVEAAWHILDVANCRRRDGTIDL
jgi:hypothetical protein